MPSLSGVWQQLAHAWKEFDYLVNHTLFGPAIGVLLLAMMPLCIRRALRARRDGLIYSSREQIILIFTIFLMGAENLLIHLGSGNVHLLGDLLGIAVFVPAFKLWRNRPNVIVERAEYEAAKQAKASGLAGSTTEAWPPAPARPQR